MGYTSLWILDGIGIGHWVAPLAVRTSSGCPPKRRLVLLGKRLAVVMDAGCGLLPPRVLAKLTLDRQRAGIAR